MNRLLTIFGVLVVVLLVSAGPASADRTVVQIEGDGSTFAGSVGGWTSTADYAGLCIAGASCPSMTGSYQASGGTGGAGDGFIRVTSGTTIASVGLLAYSAGIWESPTFTYQGVGDVSPDEVSLRLDRRAGVASLLSVGVEIAYDAELINRSGGPDVTLASAVPVTSGGWAMAPSVEVAPWALEVGDEYNLRITTRIDNLVGLLSASGTIDFDNVRLVSREYSVDSTAILAAAGAPSAGVGLDGDFYIDTAGGVLYGPKAGGAWPSPGLSLVGPQGSPGTDGSSVLGGTGAPAGSVGEVGDFYIDTAGEVIYGPKTASGWGVGTSLKGENGENGSSILSGSGAPTSATGADGDFYIDQDGPTIYGPKAGGAWPASGADLTGPQGPPGTPGSPGTDGSVIYSGPGAPSSSLGAEGDFYVDTDGPSLYGPKAAAGWGTSIALGSVGPTGPAGDPGAAGEDGAPGSPGSDGSPGSPGSDGSPGATGSTGATGAAGAEGPRGSAGPAGPAGEAGTGSGTGSVPASVPAGVAYLEGHTLYLRVTCPKRFKPSCKAVATAVTKPSGGKQMSAPARATVASGGWKRVPLQVKPAFLKQVEQMAGTGQKALTVQVRITSQAGAKKRAVYYKLRVRTA